MIKYHCDICEKNINSETQVRYLSFEIMYDAPEDTGFIANIPVCDNCLLKAEAINLGYWENFLRSGIKIFFAGMHRAEEERQADGQ